MSPLTQILSSILAAAPNGKLPFAEVMEMALYHPEHGYYGPGPRRIGRCGDFYTAVSVGPLYGQLLARLADKKRAQMAEPEGFAIIEQAAHDGQLAEDILSASEADYIIVEPNSRYEAAQRERLASFGSRVQWVSSLNKLPQLPALFICNELPDAMPVHLIRWNGSHWEELYVECRDHQLAFTAGEPSSLAVAQELTRLPSGLPAGYTTEIHLASLAWIRELAAAPFHGGIYIADYGMDEHELYAPERTSGTLRRYLNHTMDDRVLEDLGLADLTTHVPFSRLVAEAEAVGLQVREYELQGRFLGKLGLPILASLEGRMDPQARALLRQYHSLTHPAFMGRSFRILTLDKPPPARPL